MQCRHHKQYYRSSPAFNAIGPAIIINLCCQFFANIHRNKDAIVALIRSGGGFTYKGKFLKDLPKWACPVLAGNTSNRVISELWTLRRSGFKLLGPGQYERCLPKVAHRKSTRHDILEYGPAGRRGLCHQLRCDGLLCHDGGPTPRRWA
jgi:hypothetical protein